MKLRLLVNDWHPSATHIEIGVTAPIDDDLDNEHAWRAAWSGSLILARLAVALLAPIDEQRRECDCDEAYAAPELQQFGDDVCSITTTLRSDRLSVDEHAVYISVPRRAKRDWLERINQTAAQLAELARLHGPPATAVHTPLPNLQLIQGDASP